ncbi:hypothetical protein PsorP6_001172 [Peronosclerospora sorghi]|uniref:Uncharacterized protein n=1 Tax=Peronosclerospora sorghi TaxID=230839 RepID=A0ACC0WV97_9STRA|nr:hypothetical protein PsorP6_001172 [Peronosclerospora sorghi]
MTAQADKLFEKGKFDRGAVIYAKTTQENSGLFTFFTAEIESLSSEEKMQKTVLCPWIVELFLDKFHVLKGSTQGVYAHANMLFEIKLFLQDQKSYLDPATTFNLISNHGRPDELVFYATLIEDYEKVITYHMDREDYGAAIEMLRSAETSKVEELWCKHSPELIIHKPRRSISVV